jgi:hypothetical protein
VLYQPLTFNLVASDPTPADQAGRFTYAVNWGDHTSESVAGSAATTDTHAYPATGTYTVTLTATDQDGGVSGAVSQQVVIVSTPQLQYSVLVVPGTAGNDTFTLTPVLPAGAAAYSLRLTRTTGGKTTALGTYAVGTGQVQIYGGPGSDAVVLNGTGGNDTFAVSDGNVVEQLAQGTPQATAFAVDLNGIGAVRLNGSGGSDALVGPGRASTWDLTGNGQGTLNGAVTFAGFRSLDGSGHDTLVGANGTNNWGVTGPGQGTVNGIAFQGFTRLQGGTGNDWFSIATGVTAAGAIDGGGGNDTLAVQSPSGTTSTWQLTGLGSGTVNGTTFADIANLRSGGGHDDFQFLPGGAVPGTLVGGGHSTLDYSRYGSPAVVNLQSRTATGVGGTFTGVAGAVGSGLGDTLIGADRPANTWNVTGPGAGNVYGFTFAQFANLTGGSGADLFRFADGAGVAGVIDGGGGSNTLDYSAYRTGVYVNLRTGTATGTGGIANVQNVTGGQGNDILVGDGQGNMLIDRSGRNLLVGGGGADSLVGGNNGDILIDGTTAFDTNVAALDAILTEWARTDQNYLQRVAALQAGVAYTDAGGAEVAALTADGTVFPGGAGPGTLTGGGGLDWFFAQLGSTVKNLRKSETVSII